MKNNLLVIDMDAIKYAAACVSEKRTIKVVHKSSGREKEFKTRTEFYGRDKKSGWLGERNKGMDEPFTVEDFEIFDIQTPDLERFARANAKAAVEKIFNVLGTTNHIGFLGEGDSHRLGASTILKYKGNREGMLRPIHLDSVSEYLLKTFNVEKVVELEADDWCAIECYKNDNILCAIDKDAYGTASKVFNFGNPDDGVIDCDCFGELRVNDKNKVKGFGRQFFYFQVASGDSIDNYKANSASSKKWGEKSAYDALCKATNDTEALKALLDVYRKLYPEPIVVEGWRKDKIEVDWLYMLTEVWNMARMFTTPNDKFYDQQDMLNLFEMYGVKS